MSRPRAPGEHLAPRRGRGDGPGGLARHGRERSGARKPGLVYRPVERHNLPSGRERGGPAELAPGVDHSSPGGQERPGDRRDRVPRPGRVRAPPARLPRHADHPARPAAAGLERARPGRVDHRPSHLQRAPRQGRRRRDHGHARRARRGRRRRLHAGGPRGAGRARRGHPLRGRGRVRPADRRGLHHEPARRRPLLRGGAGVERGTASPARLDRVRRGHAQGRDPRDDARPPRRLADRGRPRAPRPRGRRGREPQARAPRLVPEEGAIVARPRRAAVGLRRRGGTAQVLGDQAPRAVRAGASADARLAGQLHVHEGDGRARRRGARRQARRAALDRSPVDHRVELRAPVPGMDRGFQDGRADHPGVRPRHDPGVPRHPRGHRRHHPGRLRRERDARRGGAPARAREPRVLPRELRLPEPVAVQGPVQVGARVLRARPAAPAGPRHGEGAGMDVPRQPPRRAAAQERRARRRARGQGDHAPSEVEEDARAGRAPGSRQGPRRLHPPVRGSLRRLHRGRGHLHGRPDGRAVSLAVRRRTRSGSRSTRPRSTGATTCRTSTARR